jgi:hypothetical protein
MMFISVGETEKRGKSLAAVDLPLSALLRRSALWVARQFAMLSMRGRVLARTHGVRRGNEGQAGNSQ